MAAGRPGPLSPGDLGTWSVKDLEVWLRSERNDLAQEIAPGYRVFDLLHDLSEIAEAIDDELRELDP